MAENKWVSLVTGFVSAPKEVELFHPTLIIGDGAHFEFTGFSECFFSCQKKIKLDRVCVFCFFLGHVCILSVSHLLLKMRTFQPAMLVYSGTWF